mmetsp:Transcript_10828/g.34487  ORF Transcript_10828/g.34487 Transcript_10828/m.34487 type:complete len:300 (+) Transcript_10828:811-1710(+)
MGDAHAGGQCSLNARPARHAERSRLQSTQGQPRPRVACTASGTRHRTAYSHPPPKRRHHQQRGAATDPAVARRVYPTHRGAPATPRFPTWPRCRQTGNGPAPGQPQAQQRGCLPHPEPGHESRACEDWRPPRLLPQKPCAAARSLQRPARTRLRPTRYVPRSSARESGWHQTLRCHRFESLRLHRGRWGCPSQSSMPARTAQGPSRFPTARPWPQMTQMWQQTRSLVRLPWIPPLPPLRRPPRPSHQSFAKLNVQTHSTQPTTGGAGSPASSLSSSSCVETSGAAEKSSTTTTLRLPAL